MLIIKASGTFDDEVFLSIFKKIGNTSGFEPGMRVLADFLDVVHVASSDAVLESVEHVKDLQTRYGQARWAVVVADVANFGMASVFVELTRSTSVEARVFRDMDMALRWLKISSEILEPALELQSSNMSQ
jgi:hypothetical protein